MLAARIVRDLKKVSCRDGRVQGEFDRASLGYSSVACLYTEIAGMTLLQIGEAGGAVQYAAVSDAVKPISVGLKTD